MKQGMTHLVLALAMSGGCGGADNKPDAKAGAESQTKAQPDASAPAQEAKVEPAADNPLLGTWELDVEGIKELDDYKNAPQAQQQMMVSVMSAMKMQMSFTAEEIQMDVSMGERTENKTGTYSITSREGPTIQIDSVMDGAKKPMTVHLNGDRIVLEQDGKKMAFKKKV